MVNCYIRTFKFWFRIIKIDTDRLPKQTYLLYNLDTQGKLNWVSKVRMILESMGFNFVWLKPRREERTNVFIDFQKFSPDNQMSFYTVGGKIVLEAPLMGGIIDGVQVAVNFSRFQRGMIEMTSGQQEEWLEEFQMWIKQAEDCALAEYWPMNDKSCHNYGGCDFLEVCNKDPAARRNKLETHFKQRVWDPLLERPSRVA